MFEVGVVAQFEAAHCLRGDFGPASRLHGHTYRAEVSVQGPTLRPDGTLCDLATLEIHTREVVAGLHYRNLDDLPGFAGQNTTAETVARYIFDQLAPDLSGQPISTLSVRVWESPNAWAGYSAGLTPRPSPSEMERGRGGEATGRGGEATAHLATLIIAVALVVAFARTGWTYFVDYASNPAVP
ncbi:MAG TPA: 6-carboxytetrahydropterin synthase, partial [Chloroflexota bacterium]|nr:6-carboxytetrahydropterin synthase [Chloroflexota bacterium]